MPRLNLSSILYDDKFNCRGRIYQHEIEPLAKLIEQSGLLNPITVRSAADAGITSHEWHLVAGHRRYQSVMWLGWDEIDATIVPDCDDQTAHRINLTENLGRKDLNPGQEMQAIVAAYGENPDVAQVAADLGVQRRWVNSRLKIRNINPKIRPYFFTGDLTAFDLSVLLTCAPTEQERIAQELLATKQAGGSSSQVFKREGKLRRARKTNEILEKITELMDIGEEPPGWRCLAWSAGMISDEELLDNPGSMR